VVATTLEPHGDAHNQSVAAEPGHRTARCKTEVLTARLTLSAVSTLSHQMRGSLLASQLAHPSDGARPRDPSAYRPAQSLQRPAADEQRSRSFRGHILSSLPASATCPWSLGSNHADARRRGGASTTSTTTVVQAHSSIEHPPVSFCASKRCVLMRSPFSSTRDAISIVTPIPSS
jgi:hypothetical protein